jgi:hypothetical protein
MILRMMTSQSAMRHPDSYLIYLFIQGLHAGTRVRLHINKHVKKKTLFFFCYDNDGLDASVAGLLYQRLLPIQPHESHRQHQVRLRQTRMKDKYDSLLVHGKSTLRSLSTF